ncbi:SDR family NAD(P)-dependent oxidoreductase [Amycolatopsis echigonensis]|uniref:3-oxoacyl-[acyl-carrier protein] reductase n=1 Tax=Amycolatopsis echigonensis TaxID=2576905 RepID=A0A2N3WFY5_9PSEU|nr:MULTISPECIES: SDR family NAD(P)-dependent oxidoreductase [Amycolatopsis]MBB2497865.1 SDR family oxidoreductase [Amycolatopsis echigonensis]PKV92783.1 3-oxoacyl-[acyl-carrier protein] reductase [Amycolatopsis niigatensis]
MSTFAGKVALVTGGTRGIGLATVRALAEAGATVVLTGRDETAAKETAASVGPSVSGRALDVTDAKAVAAVVKDVAKEHGRLDVAVANAGIMEGGLLGMIRPDDVDRTLSTNVAGTLHTVQAAARAMMRKKTGAIVVLASVVGEYGSAGQTVYAASKAAVANIARSAAKELGRSGIRVNAVAPGVIETALTESLSEDARASNVAKTPLGRLGQAEEVAAVIRFLASDEASFVTGQVLGIDGGLVL